MRVGFDTSLQPGLMLAFFATIGLGADARMLARGGVALLLFTACVVGMLVMQNVISVGAALAMGIDPLIGLIAGVGDDVRRSRHTGAAAWGQQFAESFGVAAAPGIALAAATFGLVMGGLIGGPVTRRLIERLKARGAPLERLEARGAVPRCRGVDRRVYAAAPDGDDTADRGEQSRSETPSRDSPRIPHFHAADFRVDAVQSAR